MESLTAQIRLGSISQQRQSIRISWTTVDHYSTADTFTHYNALRFSTTQVTYYPSSTKHFLVQPHVILTQLFIS